MAKSNRTVAASALLLALTITGCNTSRYGVMYDQRLAQLKRIAVVPATIDIYSIHSGGVLELRPDEAAGVSARTIANVANIVRERGREPLPMPAPASRDAAGESLTPQLALIAAVLEAIVTHHYEHGKERTFRYEVGDATGALSGQNNDAVLCIYLRGVIPTAGRQILKATAIAVGFLTGAHFHVKTNELVVMLMLIDRGSGQVLWFNQYQTEASVTDEGDLRRAIEKACDFLLRPRE